MYTENHIGAEKFYFGSLAGEFGSLKQLKRAVSFEFGALKAKKSSLELCFGALVD